jgi:hypothetical protein
MLDKPVQAVETDGADEERRGRQHGRRQPFEWPFGRRRKRSKFVYSSVELSRRRQTEKKPRPSMRNRVHSFFIPTWTNAVTRLRRALYIRNIKNVCSIS